MRCLGSELQRERPSGCSHGDTLPASSRVGLSGVYFPWGTSLLNPFTGEHSPTEAMPSI